MNHDFMKWKKVTITVDEVLYDKIIQSATFNKLSVNSYIKNLLFNTLIKLPPEVIKHDSYNDSQHES